MSIGWCGPSDCRPRRLPVGVLVPATSLRRESGGPNPTTLNGRVQAAVERPHDALGDGHSVGEVAKWFAFCGRNQPCLLAVPVGQRRRGESNFSAGGGTSDPDLLLDHDLGLMALMALTALTSRFVTGTPGAIGPH